MHPIWFGLVMETGDECDIILHIQFLFRYPLGNHVCVVVEADDRIVAIKFSEEFVAACLVNTDLATLLLTGNLGLLDQSLDEIINVAAFCDKNIKLILKFTLVKDFRGTV
jgi:hypothetical protein